MLTYTEQNKSFTVTDNDVFLFSVPFLFPDKENGRTFTIEQDNFIFSNCYKKDIAENEIVTIYYNKYQTERNKEGRIGWAIPLISLTSKEHDYADKSFFGYYAFACYAYILSNDNFINFYTDNGYENFETAILDYYNENEVIIIIDKSNCNNENIDLGDFITSIALFGYSHNKYRECITTDTTSKIRLEHNANISFLDNTTKEYSEKLCQGQIYDENPHIRFLKLYQLIELLISHIMLNKFKIIMNKAEKGFASARDFESCLKNNSEIDRIKELCNKSGIIPSQYDYIKELDDICQDFLKNIGDEEDLTFPTSLYHFRNTMVHKFRFMESEEAIVSKVNDLFEMFLLRLMINIKTL